MDTDTVYLDGAERIMNLAKTTFGSLFTYYLGAPDIIPESAMPALIVVKVAGTVTVDATMTDLVTEQVMIHMMVNGKIGYGTPDDDDTVMRQLFTMIEGRDPVTGFFLPTSLMYALRFNITLGNAILDSDIATNYDVTPRPDQPTITEGLVVVTISERVLVPNRV